MTSTPPISTDMDMMTDFEVIITNLKIISNVKPNDKLTVRDNILDIDKPYYYQGVQRWWNDDSRTNTLQQLEKIIHKAFTIIDNIYKSEMDVYTQKPQSQLRTPVQSASRRSANVRNVSTSSSTGSNVPSSSGDNYYMQYTHGISSSGRPSTDSTAQSASSNYFKNENSHQLQTFSLELKNSVKGLQNLQMTYKSDITMCSKIDVIIDKINIRIKKIDGLLTIKKKL